MSDTDKTKPARVKLAQGEKLPKGYIARDEFYRGRDDEWRVSVKARSGKDRAALRVATRRALTTEDVEDVDILPAVTGGRAGTAWDVY